MDVSIIIVNYNTITLTQNCIDSIVEKTAGIKYEIIVVDNASTDGSREILEQDTRIRYFYSDRNGGFGYGNNIGMRNALGKYFFLLNSDTLLVNNAIKYFFDYAESHNYHTIYGCYLEGVDGTYSHSYHTFPAFTVFQFLHRFIRKENNIIDYSNKEVECVCGADMFLPRSVIEKVGFFDENIFLYGEEGEWQYRMALSGYKRMVLNMPRIIHLEGQSSNSKAFHRYALKSHLYVLRKHMNPLTFLLAKVYYYARLYR